MAGSSVRRKARIDALVEDAGVPPDHVTGNQGKGQGEGEHDHRAQQDAQLASLAPANARDHGAPRACQGVGHASRILRHGTRELGARGLGAAVTPLVILYSIGKGRRSPSDRTC